MTAQTPHRLIIIGAGAAGLAAAIEANALECAVDVVDRHKELSPQVIAEHLMLPPANALMTDEARAELKLALDFFNSIGMQVPAHASGAEFPDSLKMADISEAVYAAISAMDATDTRILSRAEAIQFLTDKDGAVTGVHVHTLNADNRVVSQANLFADAVILCTDKTAALAKKYEEQSKRRISTVNEKLEAVDTEGRVISGLYLFADTQRHVAHAVASGIRAARSAASAPVKHFKVTSRGAVPEHIDYVDESGVFHETALKPDVWLPLKLENRIQLTEYNHLLRFALPKKTDQTGLFCGQFLAIRVKCQAADGQLKDIVRYYSPVSRNSEFGHLDLLIKLDAKDMQQKGDNSIQNVLYNLRPGDTVEFQGPAGGFVYHRNTYRSVGMIAGGTGITPMMQILRSVANHPEDRTEVSLVYGSQREDEVLCREELLYYSATRTNLRVYITLESPPPNWSMGKGFITPDVLRQRLPPPSDRTIILLCGPPNMIAIMKRHLLSLGYTEDMWFDFLEKPKPRKRTPISRRPTLSPPLRSQL